PDSRQLMTAGVDGAVRLWDLGPVTGGTSKGAQPVELVESTLFRQESSEVSDVIYSFDGQKVALLVPGQSIVVLDAGSGEQLLEITGVGGLSTEIAFNPEGSRLAGSSGDLEATIWDAGTGEKVLTVNDSSTITDIDFTPDNRFLATATIDGTVSLWDMVTGRKSHRLAGHASWIEHISFNPVTGKLATSGVDGLTRIWDLNQAASELFSIAAHQGAVYDAVFNADGSKIASAGEDGLVKLWDGETGELLHALPGPLEWPHYPAF
ncbi:unnamed protein product, partial [marine sediment metagenome]